MSLERNKYPEKNSFLLRQNNTKYTYNIINEGYYSPKNMLRYTSNYNTSSGKTQYKIPDGYLVETKSSSNIATEYLRRNGSNSYARIFGIHVFGLNAIDVEQERERKEKKIEHVPLNHLNISITTTNEISHIDDDEVEKEMLKYIRKAEYRKITDILLFVIPANANYFCSCCLCSKKEIGIKSKIYMIEKTMEQLQTTKPPPGHSKDLESYVVQELKSENRYDNNIRTIISSEMQKISVKFHFWQDYDTQNWNNTPLMGDDKEL
ncbi:41742_t:CDS:2, partial [Gigaspora margarita]